MPGTGTAVHHGCAPRILCAIVLCALMTCVPASASSPETQTGPYGEAVVEIYGQADGGEDAETGASVTGAEEGPKTEPDAGSGSASGSLSEAEPVTETEGSDPGAESSGDADEDDAYARETEDSTGYADDGDSAADPDAGSYAEESDDPYADGGSYTGGDSGTYTGDGSEAEVEYYATEQTDKSTGWRDSLLRIVKTFIIVTCVGIVGMIIAYGMHKKGRL